MKGADYNPPIVNPQSVNQSNIYFAPFNLLNGPPVPVNPPVGSNGRYLLPDGIGINYFTDPLNSYRIPSVQFWNFTVQQQLTPTIALQVAYVGNVGRHLFESLNRNQAVPGPGDVDPRRPFYNTFGLEQGLYQYCNCSTSNYNALQTRFQKQFSRGLDFLLTYTWAKALNYASEGSGGCPSNIYDGRNDYGPASFDRTQTTTFTFNWDIPVGRNRHWKLGNNAIADAIIGGWRLSGVNTFGTGLPFTPTVNSAPLLNDPDFSQVRADLIGNPSVPNPNANLSVQSRGLQRTAATLPPRHRQQLPSRTEAVGIRSLSFPRTYCSANALSSSFAPTPSTSSITSIWETLPADEIDGSGPGQITYLQLPMRQMQFGLHFQF